MDIEVERIADELGGRDTTPYVTPVDGRRRAKISRAFASGTGAVGH